MPGPREREAVSVKDWFDGLPGARLDVATYTDDTSVAPPETLMHSPVT